MGKSLIKSYRGLVWLVSLGAPIFFIIACLMAFTEKTFLNYQGFGWTAFGVTLMYLLGAMAIAMMAYQRKASEELKNDFITWGIGAIAYAVQSALALFRHHHQDEADYVKAGLPSEVSDYNSVPMALADARFEVYVGYMLAMNTLFFCFFFKQEFANTLWRWIERAPKSSGSSRRKGKAAADSANDSD